MANNPNVNKVVYGNQTVMDISDTTAEEGDVVSGKTFYKASGARSTGSAVIPDISNCYQTTDTEETSIANTDYFPYYDTSATAKRKTKWSNIKSVLKTYFNGVYAALTHTHEVSDITDMPNVPSVVDNLTSTSTTDALSAYQGKYLYDTCLNTNETNYGTADLIDADKFLFVRPASGTISTAKFSYKWSALKSQLKAYFDTLYVRDVIVRSFTSATISSIAPTASATASFSSVALSGYTPLMAIYRGNNKSERWILPTKSAATVTSSNTFSFSITNINSSTTYTSFTCTALVLFVKNKES